MVDEIKPISKIKKISRIRRVKLSLHKNRTMKGLYYNEMFKRAYDEKVKSKIVQTKTTETDESSTNSKEHIIDTFC